MSSKRSSDGSGVVGAVIFVIVIIALIPKTVWIVLGVITAIVLAGWVTHRIVAAEQKRRAEAQEQAKRERKERARQEKQRRIDTLGTQNAALLESALSSVKQVTSSEAARAGWLGDVDFSADIKGITESFEKAHGLRGVTDKLSALSKPSVDDRKILAEAKTTVANLERAAIERVELINRCATEALLIDKSLRTEREDAQVAEERAELHGKLSAMLYGIETAPDTTPRDSAVDAVMARVQAYREIKNRIHDIRSDDT